MPSSRWPFTPDRLSDILSVDTIRFLQSGIAVRLGASVAIVESPPAGSSPDSENGFLHHRPDDKWLRFSEFCRYFRGEDQASGEPAFVGADEACRQCDIRSARRFLGGDLELPDGQRVVVYPCHMELLNCIAPIELGGTCIALLVTGQRSTEDGIARVLDRIAAIEGGTHPDVQVGSGNLAKLRSLASEIERFPDDTPQRLELEAKAISASAKLRWTVRKTDAEEEFFREIWIDPAATKKALDVQVQGQLDKIRAFCGLRAAAFFAIDNGNQSTLDLVAWASKPRIARPKDIHFNWKKGNLPERAIQPTSELDQQAMVRGIRGDTANFAADTQYIAPVSASGKYRAALCLAGFPGDTDLPAEGRFLNRIGLRLGYTYLTQLHTIKLLEREEIWEAAVGLMGHQVRSSLQPISLAADTVKRHVVDGEDWETKERLASSLQTIRLEARALGQYATEALEFWGWIMGRERRSFERQELADLIEECAKRLRDFGMESGISISIDERISSLPQIETFGRTLEIVFYNLIENAIKYSFEDREVRILGRQRADKIEITVEDYGIGIPPEEREKVFQKGYRGRHRGRKTTRKGAGLGMWQSIKIVEAHGGTISCTSHSGSREPQPGDVHGFRTSFTVVLPIDQ